MRIVFFGTPEFAVPSLRALLRARHEVVGVVTQPDRPQGRSRSQLLPPPVKLEALAAGIPVLQPDRPVGDLFAASLRRLGGDVGVVVAYGHILRPEILAIPPDGMINVHASLLPHLRGAAPIQHAILRGDPVTGVSIMQMEAGLDSGPVLHRLETPIQPDDTSGTLTLRLSELGAEALLDALSLLAAGAAGFERQDESRATYAPKIDRTLARVQWDEDACGVARRAAAFDPAPGAWTRLEELEVKLFGVRALDGAADGAPGTVLQAGDTLTVAAAGGAVEVSEVQPAGRRRIPVSAWVNGRGVTAGARFV